MSIKLVIEKNHCMVCGGCSLVCPTNAISMEYNKEAGLYRPIINSKKCIDCGKCENVCPSNHQSTEGMIGNYISIYLAHSKDLYVRHLATSGGVINSFVRYILDEKVVEYVLLTRYDASSPIEASAILLSKNECEEMKKKPRDYASRYVVVPILETLKNFDIEKRKIAVVGTPCQLQALKKIIGRLNDNIILIGLACSGGMRFTATEEYKRLKKAGNATMYYRGNGWPGTNNLISDKVDLEYNHLGSLYERMFSSQIFKNPGCRYCKDHFAEQADISFCDYWDIEEIQNEKEGNSCIIVRSKKARQLFNDLVENDYIEIVKELQQEDVVKTQVQVINCKKGNVRNSLEYLVFIRIIDIFYKFRIFKIMPNKMYSLFSLYYYNLCIRKK